MKKKKETTKAKSKAGTAAKTKTARVTAKAKTSKRPPQPKAKRSQPKAKRPPAPTTAKVKAKAKAKAKSVKAVAGAVTVAPSKRVVSGGGSYYAASADRTGRVQALLNIDRETLTSFTDAAADAVIDRNSVLVAALRYVLTSPGSMRKIVASAKEDSAGQRRLVTRIANAHASNIRRCRHGLVVDRDGDGGTKPLTKKLRKLRKPPAGAVQSSEPEPSDDGGLEVLLSVQPSVEDGV